MFVRNFFRKIKNPSHAMGTSGGGQREEYIFSGMTKMGYEITDA